MAADREPSEPGGFRRAWRRWRQWRHTRPFWGGLLVTLGGVEILVSERAPLPLVIHIGLQGLAGYLTPAILVICGLLLLFHPVQRVFYSLLAIVLSLGSWITSNLGGFFVGLLLGLIGGCLAFAWVQRDRREPARKQGAPPPRHARSAGLALVRGGSRSGGSATEAGDPAGAADRQAGPPGRPSDRAAGGPAGAELAGPPRPTPALPPGRPSGAWSGGWTGNPVYLAMPLAPLALTMLAAVASRGLLAGSAPLAPPAASPSVSPLPGPPTVPTPRPSPEPTSSRGGGGHRHRAAGRPAAAAAADQFSLTSRFAALTGMSYDGIASVPTAHGMEKMLKFSMTSLKLPGVVLTVTRGGRSFVTADSSMEFSGNVELYTTKISGNLGGVRVTFTSAAPPSGLPANLTLTSVVAEQPFATADLLNAVGSQVSTG